MKLTEEQIREAAEIATENRYQEKMEDMPAFSSTIEAANGYNDGYREGAKWIQEQQPKWISVNDRLPENDDFMLCSINNGVLVYGCWYSEDTNYWYGHGIARPQEGITHWMPLPEPPTYSTT